jgi:hypothetical protein
VLVGGIKGSTVKLIDFGLSYRTANMQVSHPSESSQICREFPYSSLNVLPFPPKVPGAAAHIPHYCTQSRSTFKVVRHSPSDIPSFPSNPPLFFPLHTSTEEHVHPKQVVPLSRGARRHSSHANDRHLDRRVPVHRGETLNPKL